MWARDAKILCEFLRARCGLRAVTRMKIEVRCAFKALPVSFA